MIRKLFLSIFIIFLLVSLAYAVNWLTNADILGGWLMDVDEDPITDNSTGGTYPITLKGDGEPDYATATPPDAYSTGYYDWDGSDDYASTGNFDLSATDKCSVVFWWRPDVASTGDDIILEMSDNVNSYQDSWLSYFESAETIQSLAQGNVGYSSWRTATTFTPGTWYHIAIIFDKSLASSETYMYVNGISDGATIGGSDANNTNNFGNRPLYFGSRNNSSLFCNMKMDEPAVFGDVLTITEVNDIIDNGLYEAAAGAGGQIMRLIFY